MGIYAIIDLYFVDAAERGLRAINIKRVDSVLKLLTAGESRLTHSFGLRAFDTTR